MEYSPKKITDFLVKNGFEIKKKFGQNFITDENIINSIINKSNIDEDTLVIEVGPGIGSLTYKLCQNASNVIAFEIDKTLENLLKETLKEFNNCEIIYEDFLKANVANYIKKYNCKKIYLVANLPYYITTPIIMKVIEDKLEIEKLVIMVQKEVGNRFKAKPNSKEYNSLSVYLEYYFEINKIMDVSPNVFIPKPNVDSIVLELVSKKEKAKVKNEELFFKLIKDSFVQKRKTIKNNLKSYDLNIIEKVLKKYNLNLSTRAEQIDLSIFVEIANELEG